MGFRQQDVHTDRIRSRGLIMRYRAVVIALLAALPLVLLVAWSLPRTLSRFFDPCFRWGVSQPATVHISPESPCRSVGGTSETKLHAVVRLLFVHGGILLAIVLGLLGAFISRPFLSVLGAGLIFLESVPLIFSFAWLTVFVSGLFLLAARAGAPVQGGAKTGSRLIGSLGALAGLAYLPSLLKGAPLFLIFLVIALAFVAVIGWWPVRGRRHAITNQEE